MSLLLYYSASIAFGVTLTDYICCISLYLGRVFTAWLPDIITSLVNGTSLKLIKVYTTEITNVLDMGIISPLIFLTLYLLNRGSFMGYVLLRMILKVCIGIGIMLPVQSAFQMLAGISIPIPVFISKVLIFVMLVLAQDQKFQVDVEYITAFHTAAGGKSIKLIFMDSHQHTVEVIVKEVRLYLKMPEFIACQFKMMKPIPCTIPLF